MAENELTSEFSVPSFSREEADEILANAGRDISESVKKSMSAIEAKRAGAREAALLETGNGCRQLLSESKRPPGAGVAVNTWWRQHEALQARAQKLDELQAVESRLAQLKQSGDMGSPARQRIEKEVTRLKQILGK